MVSVIVIKKDNSTEVVEMKEDIYLFAKKNMPSAFIDNKMRPTAIHEILSAYWHSFPKPY